jgi:hypothetical protein
MLQGEWLPKQQEKTTSKHSRRVPQLAMKYGVAGVQRSAYCCPSKVQLLCRRTAIDYCFASDVRQVLSLGYLTVLVRTAQQVKYGEPRTDLSECLRSSDKETRLTRPSLGFRYLPCASMPLFCRFRENQHSAFRRLGSSAVPLPLFGQARQVMDRSTAMELAPANQPLRQPDLHASVPRSSSNSVYNVFTPPTPR